MASTTPGSLGTTYLLAYVSDGESAASIRGLMHRQNVRDFAVEPGGAAEAAEYLKNHASPQTLIVEVPSAEAAPGLLDALADVVNPATRVIVTGKVDTFSFYHWLMELGIHDYLLLPFNEQQLASALQKHSGAAASNDENKAEQQRKMVAVIGARGGVGATSIATNLAGIFADEHKLTTGLIDLDSQFGSVALGLDLEASRGLRDALEKPDRIDTLFLERVMMKGSAQLSILSAEEPLAETIEPHATASELLFAALREKFPMLVVDLPRHLSAMTRHVLAHADHVVLVAEPSVLSLRDTLRLRDLLVEVLKRPAPLVVVNREGMSAKHEASRQDFAKHFGATPGYYLPYLTDAMAATSRGENWLGDAKLRLLAEPLRLLASVIDGHEAPKKSTASTGKIGALLKGHK